MLVMPQLSAYIGSLLLQASLAAVILSMGSSEFGSQLGSFGEAPLSLEQVSFAPCIKHAAHICMHWNHTSCSVILQSAWTSNADLSVCF